MNRLSPVIRNAWANFGELNDRALDLIAGMHPDEDVNELVLSGACLRQGRHVSARVCCRRYAGGTTIHIRPV
ncbi:hypothetical protein [Paenibacillus lautus]|uniref:hypothetical protein n=1 Tax=Paenibacillus lautus TaxID=1401 RepID=UPI003D9A77DD